MAIKPVRSVTKTITPSGANLVLLDDGVSMGKATLADAVTTVAGPLADTKIAALNLNTASQKTIEFFATAAQGTKADAAIPSSEIGSTVQAYSARLKSLADATDGTTGQVVARASDGSLEFSDAGTGDVVGPASAVANSIALFTDTSGKSVDDGSVTRGSIAELSVGGNYALAPVHIGDRNENNSNNCVVLISRDFDGSGTLGTDDGHAFSDSTDISRTGGIAYNSFDARVDITGDNYDHYAAFQADPDIAISGTLSKYYGSVSAGEVIRGTVTNYFGFYAFNMYGAGTVTNQYGLFVPQLNKGTTANWAVYTDGSTPSYFGGPLDLSRSTAGQIKFPASQNASSNANTLDDYEEGSWTPTIAASTGTITSTSDISGTYTKIGNRVFFELAFSIVTNGTGSGFITATLPIVNGASNFVCVGAINSGGSEALYGVAAGGGTQIFINTAVGAYPGANGRSYTMSGNYPV